MPGSTGSLLLDFSQGTTKLGARTSVMVTKQRDAVTVHVAGVAPAKGLIHLPSDGTGAIVATAARVFITVTEP